MLDATYCKARIGGRVVSQAVVITTGVSADGHRELPGVDVGDPENEELLSGKKLVQDLGLAIGRGQVAAV